MKEYIIPSDNFIAGWYIDHKVCDGLISYFDESPDQGPGEIGSGISKEYKVSTDVAVIPKVDDERIQTYLGLKNHQETCEKMIELQKEYWPEAKRKFQPIDIEYLSCECRKYYSYVNCTKSFEGKNVFKPI